MVLLDHVATIINEACHLIDLDINLALSKFNECFLMAGECMKKPVYVWFGENKNVV